jgi:hypothetical protein
MRNENLWKIRDPKCSCSLSSIRPNIFFFSASKNIRASICVHANYPKNRVHSRSVVNKFPRIIIFCTFNVEIKCYPQPLGSNKMLPTAPVRSPPTCSQTSSRGILLHEANLRFIYRFLFFNVVLNASWRSVLTDICISFYYGCIVNSVLSCFIQNCCQFQLYRPYPFPSIFSFRF